MALNPFVHRVAKRFKDAIVATWGDRILEVRVFGSMVRGDSDETSDLDVFVKVEEKARPLVRSIVDAACVVSEEETGYRPALAPLIMARADFDELVRRERRIALDVLNEGVLI